jgi:carboxyl-terminal processing protease
MLRHHRSEGVKPEVILNQSEVVPLFSRNRWIPGLLAGALLFWGANVLADGRRSNQNEVMESLETFTRVFEKINSYYVDENISPQELIDKAIEGMLSDLDPHSQFLDTRMYDDLMTSTQGSFGGLGIEISLREKYPTVVSPIEGTPAYNQGIQGGDQIVEIEGEDTYGWAISKAISKLRGPKGTEVHFMVKREGIEQPIGFTVVRDIIEIESVRHAFKIGDIGYVRIVNFAQDTAEELEQRILELEGQGINGLILDLRYNPGGLLRAARDVGELFLDSGKKIVYTRGRTPRQNADYYSTTPATKVHGTEYPIVVMINEASASASEIVAGALQDWDTAVIVGKTSFGKGSVQTVYPLSEHEALKLTTAKYYTPSGRCIHKEDRYAEEEGEMPDDEDHARLNEEEKTNEAPDPEEAYQTVSGRPVTGGGGIIPDIVIEQPDLSAFAIDMERNNYFFKFAIKYVSTHPNIAEVEEVATTPAMMTAFEELLADDGFEYKPEEMQENSEYVERGIRREIVRRLHGSKAAYQVRIEGDEQLKTALDLFKRGRTLKELYAVQAADLTAIPTLEMKQGMTPNAHAERHEN